MNRSKLQRRRFASVLLLAVITTLASCSSDSAKLGLELPEGRISAELIPARSIDRAAIAGRRLTDVVVREAAQKEAEHAPPDTLTAFAAGAGFVGVGAGEVLLIGPMAGGVVAGGIVIAPLLLSIGIQSDIIRHNAAAAIAKEDFLGATAAALRRDLQIENTARPTADQSRGLRLEVVAYRWGLMSASSGFDSGSDRNCFLFEGYWTLSDNERELYRDTIVWRVDRRSVELPPPRCATLEAYAADDGKLIHAVWTESSEIIAALVLRRLGGET